MTKEEIEKLTDREKDAAIAKWLGWSGIHEMVGDIWGTPPNYRAGIDPPTPWLVFKFTTSDAAAITLLPELKKRGYATQLICGNPQSDGWYFGLRKGALIESAIAPTISAAIVNAILQLPEVQP